MSFATILTGHVRSESRRWTARQWALVALLLAGLAAGLAMALLGRWPMIRVVETGRTPEYPYLEPLSFSELPALVFDQACEVVEKMAGWTITTRDRDEGIIHGRVVTRPFGFESEITIRVTRVEGVTNVNVRSELVGSMGRFGDFGQNARNVRRFLRELRARVDAGVPTS